jgi:O-antigen/teichoic acid export membrane protein
MVELHESPQRSLPERESSDALHLSLIRGLAWIGGAKTAIQAVTWAGTVVVAHFLVPEDYGLLQLALVFLNFLTNLNELSIGFAVVTLRGLTPVQIAQLNGVALGAGVLTAVFACAVAPLLGPLFGSPSLPWLIALLSPSFVINAARTVPQALLQRELSFRPLALLEAGQALAGALATLVLAVLGLGYLSLALGRLVQIGSWTLGTLAIRRAPLALPRVEPVREALRFSFDLSAARIAWYAYANLHFLLVGHYLGTAALGAFTFAWTLAHIAVDRIAALLVGVVPSYFALIHDQPAQLRRYFLALTEALALAVIPVTFGTSLIAADFVPLLLGERWSEAIGPLQILPIYAAYFAISSLLAHVLRVVGETRFFMIWNVITCVGIVAAVSAALPWGTTAVSWAWVLAYPLLTFPQYVRAFQRLSLSTSEYLRALGPALSSGAVMGIAVLACRSALASEPATLRLAALIAVGAASYSGFALWVHGARVREMATVVRRALR